MDYKDDGPVGAVEHALTRVHMDEQAGLDMDDADGDAVGFAAPMITESPAVGQFGTPPTSVHVM